MVRVQIHEHGASIVRDVPLEDYVLTTVLSEVDPSSRDRALLERMYEVQAIVSRSYALSQRGRHQREGFDLCSTTHCQLYEPSRVGASRWTEVARGAVARTRGKVLWYDGAPAQPLFHADCGGRTSDATSVWGGRAPRYLASTRDDGPARAAHVDWTFDARLGDLRNALNRDPRTAVGASLASVRITARDPSGRAEWIVLRGTRTRQVRGEVFREAVTRGLGARTLRSTLFTLRRSGDRFVFTGHGFGHGVGLCQVGALARLKAGASPERVLAFYFPGATVQ
jgi:stage II sporulation protein D